MDERDGVPLPEATSGGVGRVSAGSGPVGWIIHVLKRGVRDWYDLHRRSNTTNVLIWAFCFELVLMAVLLVLLPFDSVQVDGRHRFIKPLNFTLSMAVYLATLVILVDHLRATDAWKKIISWGVSICMVTAITCITMQAVRGTSSHFNNATPFDTAVSLLMDIVDPLNGALVVVLLIFALQSRFNVAPSTQLGIVLGTAVFLVGSVVGGVMVVRGQSVVGVAPGGPGLPVLNWSVEGGDFRVSHFLGIHALQVLPVAGWLINQMESLSARAKQMQVVAVSAVYVLLMVLAFLQAMNGAPLMRI